MDTVAYNLAEDAADMVCDVIADIRTNNIERVVSRTLDSAILTSGMAMERVRSSRPCSGAEHLLSHALDKLQNYPLLHGEQVAAFAILTLDLHGHSTRVKQLWRVYDKIGLPRTPAEFGIHSGTLAQLEKEAIQIRPERYTILHHLNRNDFKIQTN